MARRSVGSVRGAVLVLAITATIAIGGCSSGDERQFDISPIFPLSADKCASYNGEESGEGFSATCMVTKSDCERAAADWREAMRGVPDAILFTCD